MALEKCPEVMCGTLARHLQTVEALKVRARGVPDFAKSCEPDIYIYIYIYIQTIRFALLCTLVIHHVIIARKHALGVIVSKC